MSEPKPLVVVAIHKGYYGDKTRYPGERFAIADARMISTRWMVDPNGSDYTSDHRAMEAAYAAANSRGSTRTVTDEQLIAEVAQSSGVIAGLRAENLMLKEKVSALQGQLDRALAGAQGSTGSKAKARTAAVEAPEEPAETGDDGDAEEPGDVVAREEAAPRRVRRTT